MSKYSTRTTYARGIRIGDDQGTVDWTYLKDKIDFVLLEPINVNNSVQTAKEAQAANFLTNLAGARANDIPVCLSVRVNPGWYVDNCGSTEIENCTTEKDVHVQALKKIAGTGLTGKYEAIVVDATQWYYDIAQYKSYLLGDIPLGSVTKNAPMVYLYSIKQFLINLQAMMDNSLIPNVPIYIHCSPEIIEANEFTGGAKIYDTISHNPATNAPYVVSEILTNLNKSTITWDTWDSIMPEDSEHPTNMCGSWLFWDVSQYTYIKVSSTSTVPTDIFIAKESKTALINRWSYISEATTGETSTGSETTSTEVTCNFPIILDVWESKTTLDEDALIENGVCGLIVRLNDINGGHHMDELFDTLWAKANKFKSSAIYFVYNPWVTGQENYDWLIAHMPENYTHRLIVDVEVEYEGYSADTYAAQVEAFLTLCKAKYNKVSNYTGGGYISLLSYWDTTIDYHWARYPSALYQDTFADWNALKTAINTVGWNPNPSNLAPGTVKLWQCTDQVTKMDGFGNKAVDINIFNGTEAEAIEWLNCSSEVNGGYTSGETSGSSSGGTSGSSNSGGSSSTASSEEIAVMNEKLDKIINILENLTLTIKI